MTLQPTIASVVGQISDTRWGQVLQSPHAYAVVEVYAPDGGARQVGINVLSKLTNALNPLPETLKETKAIVDSLTSDKIVTLIVMVKVGAVLYVASSGGGKVFLKRNTLLAKLADGPNAISGTLQLFDTVIAASSCFVSILGETELASVFDNITPQEAAEKLTLLLHKHGEASEGGAACIYHVTDIQSQADDANSSEVITESPLSSILFAVRQRVKLILRHIISVDGRIFLRRWYRKIQDKIRGRSLTSFIPSILFVLFFISVVLGVVHQVTSASNSRIHNTIVEAEHAFEEGTALLDLNPVKGRERLAHSQALLEPFKSRRVTTSDIRKAQRLYTDVSLSLTKAMQVYTVSPELYFDLSLLKAGGKAEDMSFFNESLGLLDSVGKTVYALGVANKNGVIVGGGDAFGSAKHIAAYGDFLYVVTGTGISVVDIKEQKTKPDVIKMDSEWGSIEDMDVFGGNIYLLDIQKSRIWKYVATDKVASSSAGPPAGRQGFTELREYLNPDSFPDLSKATNMSIDGSVWLGTSTGQILRFTQGKENTFVAQGVQPEFGKYLKVYTTDTIQNVYVYDKDNSRIVILDKDGFYLSQYVWKEALTPSGFVAFEAAKKLFLLVDGKLYALKMQ